jgi:polyphosphate kinase
VLQQSSRKEGILIVRPTRCPRTTGLAGGGFPRAIFPVLTPLAIDPAHPFPFIPNLGFSIALQLRQPDGKEPMTALMRLPQALDRFIRLPDRKGAIRFITLEDAVGLFIGKLFPGYKVEGSGTFRIIRDSDIEVEEEAEDLVRFFETALKRRRRGSVIRIETDSRDAGGTARFVAGELGVVPATRSRPGPTAAGPQRFQQLVAATARRPEVHALQSPLPRAHPRFGGDCFAAIREKDIVVHHPYESFDVVVQFLRQAARDPMSWRSSRRSTAPRTTADRARADRGGRGRQVGDRAGRAEGALRRGGQHPLGARPRARRRAGGVRLHRAEDPRQDVAGGAPRGGGCAPTCHLGTGNYHPVTARIYTDLSYFTTDPASPATSRKRLQLHHRLCRAGRTREARDVAGHAAQARI